ncbi:histidine kinase [bacterium]|nr:histidine kinase [bacterium]
MRFKVRDILLVSSLYDSYLFEEDGRLYELIYNEYQGLNLSHAPEITHALNGKEALELLGEENRFDLIITSLHIEDMHVVKLAKMIRDAGFSTPIILLAYDNRERKELVSNFDTSIFENIFIWQGDYRLLIAIIKLVEDRANVEHDTQTIGVQTIILVEDNVKFFSSYLPLIYKEILKQSQELISEGVNLSHKSLRMRARPKILLCTNYEDAWACFEKYQENVLGIISDINFKRNGVKDPVGGISFAINVREKHPDIPILLQSSNAGFAGRAQEIGCAFIQKGSPRLLHELRSFMINNFGFGDFVFRLPDGTEVGRAHTLKELEEQLCTVPEESIRYHADRNHFSNWLKARTEFWLAQKLKPRTVSEFNSINDLREVLINSLRLYLDLRKRGVMTDFSKETFDINTGFARIGGGSVGGKARGLGFANVLINNYDVYEKFEDTHIAVPSAVVIGTDVFDQFLHENNLESFALQSNDDVETNRRFVEAKKFPREVIRKLKDYLELVKEPLAVRSSSLLEDSQYQPFAGVYETFMIPNNDKSLKIRLDELLDSIKRVYASTFYRAAKDYMKVTAHRLEEEKMAVIVQRMVGSHNNGRFYPTFAGVAKSYNFYPVPPQKAEDGIVLLALGLGKTVVEGGNTVRFCPKYPRHLLQFFSTKETIKNAQHDFFALNMNYRLSKNVIETHDLLVQRFDLTEAEKDGTLHWAGSTYSSENEMVYDGISRAGTRIVTFAPVLKHKIFPLPEILDLLLELGSWGVGTPVEIEFAVNMNVPSGAPKEFCVLQLRPLVLSQESEELNVDNSSSDQMVCYSQHALGNGAINDIFDIVVVDIEKFDRSKSQETAEEVGKLNAKLISLKRPYVLIGVGRWGSLDHWLGIPVTWDQISGASAIVESGFKDFDVTPSQGSHFFQNITSFRIGYFTVNSFLHEGFINWDWLTQQNAVEELQYTRHLQFESPIVVRINGHQNKGVILKPGI